MDPITLLLSVVPAQYIMPVTGVVTIAAAIAMALPAPTDASAQWYRVTYQVINTVGLNRFHAKNASTEGPKP